MTEHRIGTQEEWQAERDQLLKEEKELTRWGDVPGLSTSQFFGVVTTKRSPPISSDDDDYYW